MRTCARRISLVLAFLAACAPSAAPVRAENWPQWRGPLFNGSTTETDLPTAFGPTENVAWVADLPGAGGSTPIVWDGHVFVSGQEDGSKKLWAACLARETGKELWKVPMGTGFANRYGNTGASPSPITDGKSVWFYFGTGELAAFDLAGRQVWRRNISKDHGPFEILWDYGSTGLLHAGKLYIPVVHGPTRSGPTNKGFLLCVDPATGRDIWKRPRPSEATMEAKQAYTTPVPFERPGGAWVLVTGADHVTAHDAATGQETWRSPTYNPRLDRNYRTVVSPVTAGGMVIACAPRGGQHLYGAPVGGAGKDWAWSLRTPSPDVCTPLAYQGRFFVLAGGTKKLHCLDPRTGTTVWEGDLGGKAVFQASPTGADGKIYCINLNGQVTVLSAGEKFEVLHRVDMGGKDCRSTIVAAGGQLFIRTGAKLYCIGKRRG